MSLVESPVGPLVASQPALPGDVQLVSATWSHEVAC